MWRILALPLASHPGIRFLAFCCIQCHLYIHQAGQCLFSCHCSFIQFFFYSLAAHTFLSLRHASFAGNGWQFMLSLVFRSRRIKKDSYHDICHNKSLAFSFDTDVSQHRLTVSNPHGMLFISDPAAFRYSLLFVEMNLSTLIAKLQAYFLHIMHDFMHPIIFDGVSSYINVMPESIRFPPLK